MMMQYASHTPSGLFLCAFCDMGFTSKPECLAHMQCHLQNDRNDNHPQQHQMMIQEIPEPQMQEQVHTIVTNHQQHPVVHQGHQHHMQHQEQTHMVQVETQEHVGAEQVAVVRIYVCGNCKSTFFQESDLAQHMTSHQQLRCNICYGLFESEGHLNQHKMVHKQQAIENNVVLSNIPQIATGQHGTATIMQQTGDIMRTVNAVIQPPSIRRMNNRQQDPTKERPFSCDECGKSYVTKGVLGQHKMTHRGHKPHTCSECHRGFYNKGHLNKHLLIHKGERPFPCCLCDKRFRAKGDRESHMVTHTKVRNFECQECGKTFLQSSHRAQHWRLHHSGEEARIYACDLCEKSFRNPGNLIQHKMFHKGVRSHKCTECDKAFVMRYDLKKHMRTHTGEKPYTCETCDRSFARKATMDVHIKKMHQDKKNVGVFVKKPFGCDQCSKKFRKKTLLSKHKKRLHPTAEDIAMKTENGEAEVTEVKEEGNLEESLEDSIEESNPECSEGDPIVTEGEIKHVHIVETADGEVIPVMSVEGETVPVISAEDITIVAGVVDQEAEFIEALPNELQVVQTDDGTTSVQPTITMEVIPTTVEQQQ